MSRLTQEAIGAILRGEIAPPGIGYDEFVAMVERANLTDADWRWLLLTVLRVKAEERHLERVADDVAAIRAALARTETSLTERVDTQGARVADLDAIIRPLVTAPDEPIEEPVLEWRNLWTFWQFVPGTLRPRVLLTIWEFGNWALAVATGYVLGSLGHDWLAALGGGVILCAALFVKHELLFRWYGRVVCGVHETEHGRGREFVATLERWRGPTY